jgi:hypothetical protein
MTATTVESLGFSQGVSTKAARSAVVMTARGENVLCLVVLAVIAVLLYGSYIVGEDSRCNWMRSHDRSGYQTYCTTGGTR